jgi:hypothetical protein
MTTRFTGAGSLGNCTVVAELQAVHLNYIIAGLQAAQLLAGFVAFASVLRVQRRSARNRKQQKMREDESARQGSHLDHFRDTSIVDARDLRR